MQFRLHDCLPLHSGSMEPAFQRGDILFLDNQPTRINVGEIVVYNVKGRDVPIVHRVLETHELYVDPLRPPRVPCSPCTPAQPR